MFCKWLNFFTSAAVGDMEGLSNFTEGISECNKVGPNERGSQVGIDSWRNMFSAGEKRERKEGKTKKR